MSMRSKAIEIHQNLIARYEQYIEFLKKVPTNKMIDLTCHTYAGDGPSWMGPLIDIHCICKVFGFNKESIRVTVIAAEKLFHPLTDIPRTEEHYKQMGKPRQITDSHIKLRIIKDFTWKEVNKKDLPLYVGYEFKTHLYDAILKGVYPA